MHPLLRLAALTIALPASAVALAAWGLLDPEPRRELCGSGREWFKGVLRGRW